MRERKYIGNIGDISWLQHDGMLIFQDADGFEAVNVCGWKLHCGEAEDEYDPEMEWEVHSFELEKMLLLEDGSLVDARCGSKAWFSDEIEDIASCTGEDADELRSSFTSDDPFVLAHAYESLGGYYGYCNLDLYPEYLNREEMKDRFEDITGEEIDLLEE